MSEVETPQISQIELLSLDPRKLSFGPDGLHGPRGSEGVTKCH